MVHWSIKFYCLVSPQIPISDDRDNDAEEEEEEAAESSGSEDNDHSGFNMSSDKGESADDEVLEMERSLDEEISEGDAVGSEALSDAMEESLQDSIGATDKEKLLGVGEGEGAGEEETKGPTISEQ